MEGNSNVRHRSLRAFRRARRLNQRAAAEQAGITQSEWCRIETGKRTPRRDLAERLAAITGVSLTTLLKIRAAAAAALVLKLTQVLDSVGYT
jgi:transcriptional regulator with XRE-family HTH domain